MRNIELFDYQSDMVSRVQSAFERHNSVMVQMPTGTGKTMVLASIVFSFLKKNQRSVWIVAHRRELVSQIRETVERVFSLNTDNTEFTDIFLYTKQRSAAEGKANFSNRTNNNLPQIAQKSTDFPCSHTDSTDFTDGRLFGVDNTDSSLIQVTSIQWLSKHYDEIEEEPCLIVIDEAHHALAKTYKEMWERFPRAKFLGLTATPCRLNGKGFTDLFEVLVQSWNVPEFICKGRLATYDFVSIKTDSVTQRLVDSLQKRGADGDFQNKEMDMLLNKRPSIERLYRSFEEYGKDRKGIVYAINISHAMAIAEFYREHGIVAVAIDSKTPSSLRKELIERFKLSSFSSSLNSKSPTDSTDTTEKRLFGEDSTESSLPIQILVNVDIFSEGFDCPDVEFVQLARPTLSLAKYLQMVGRGLRVAKGKKNCVIIDNVGLYRVFGLPSQVWDWEAMFEGELKVGKRKETEKGIESFLKNEKKEDNQSSSDSEMMMVVIHDELLQALQYQKFVDSNGEYAIVKLPNGKKTVVNRQGEQLIEPGNYDGMKLLKDGILYYVPRRKSVCYYDLVLRTVIDEGPHVVVTPSVVNLCGWEFVQYGNTFYSRTRDEFYLPHRPTPYELENKGFYLRYRTSNSSTSGCQVWVHCQGGKGMMRREYDSEDICLLRGDHTHVYWICAYLYGGSIVVMDKNEDYYLVDSSLKKTYIGCNHPKNESEDLQYVIPRLAKRFRDKALRSERENKEKERLRLHEKMSGGNVEVYQAGRKWGIKIDGKIVVAPVYLQISQPVGIYCAFEQMHRHWGVMTVEGKVVVEAKYEKVEINDNRTATVTYITGKTENVQLK